MNVPQLADIPCWFIWVAFIWSIYQTSRGVAFQWLLGIDAIKGIKKRIYLLCVADGFTYLVCTLSGFYAVFLLYWMHSKGASDTAASIFLCLYGLLGLTGKLPEILKSLKLPGQ